jgi:hypothetical protein
MDVEDGQMSEDKDPHHTPLGCKDQASGVEDEKHPDF